MANIKYCRCGTRIGLLSEFCDKCVTKVQSARESQGPKLPQSVIDAAKEYDRLVLERKAIERGDLTAGSKDLSKEERKTWKRARSKIKWSDSHD